MAKTSISRELQKWIEARKRFRLSHAHVQMAQQLGLNPKKFGSLANHRQEPWKVPLPEFIEHLYEKRFGKTRPDVVVSIEEMAERIARAKTERKAARRQRRLGQSGGAGGLTVAAPDAAPTTAAADAGG